MLEPEQLETLYPEGEHPTFTRAEWRAAVANDQTLSRYWEWVYHNLTTLTPFEAPLLDCKAWMSDAIDDNTFVELIQSHMKE